MDYKYCTNCGRKNGSHAKFCEYCGANISNIKPQHKYRAKRGILNKPKFHNNHRGLYVLLIIIILILGLGGYSAYQEYSSDFGNHISSTKKSEVKLNNSLAKETLNDTWGSFQNKVNYNHAVTPHSHLPMSMNFYGGSKNKDYNILYNEGNKTYHRNVPKQHSKVNLKSSPYYSHGKYNVKYSVTFLIPHRKPFTYSSTAIFKQAGNGDWDIYKLGI